MVSTAGRFHHGENSIPLWLYAAAAFLLLAPKLDAETAVSAAIDTAAAAEISERGVSSAPELSAGSLTVAVDSERSAAVKASGAAAVDAKGVLTLERAWMKARFPWFLEGTTSRLTLGLAPLAWGRGFVFNAGDPIFGEVPAAAGLSSGAYRNATEWLASIYMPLGSFSFAEAVYLPPASVPSDKPQAKDRAGGRIQLVPGLNFLQSAETGWLHGEGSGERGYLAADGSLWADWYACASIDLRENAALDSWAVSFGALRILNAGKVPITGRFEGLLHPEENAQAWFGMVTAGIGELASAGVQGIWTTGTGDVSDRLPGGSVTAGLLADFAPVKGFTLSGQLLRAVRTEAPAVSKWYLRAGARCEF